jgi:hypothetical protein
VTLVAEQLLAGGSLEFEVEVPDAVLRPAGSRTPTSGSPAARHEEDAQASDDDRAVPVRVRMRPLTIADLQLVTRAAAEQETLLATLMVQRALVEPELTVAQVASMHAGLVHHLLDEVNRISGITSSAAQLTDAARAPIARAAHLLAREYGWSPQVVNELTLGQVLLHLELLDQAGPR